MARVIRSDPQPGWRTCARPRIHDPLDGEYGAQDEDCAGYHSEPCEIVREEVQFTFADNGANVGTSTGMDVHMVERSTVRYMPADGEWSCPHCSHPMAAFSPDPRGEYVHLSESHPDELRRRSMRQDKQAEQSISLAERQAVALEQLAAQAQDARRITELEAQLAALTARLSASEPENGPVDPPRRKTPQKA